MTIDEMKEFKKLFDVYCRHEIELGHCEGDTCDWCPIQKAYEEVEASEMRENKITVRIFDIKWDVDEQEDVKTLPNDITHTFEEYNKLSDELLEKISDWLSDEYGFCHESYQVKEIKEDQ